MSVHSQDSVLMIFCCSCAFTHRLSYITDHRQTKIMLYILPRKQNTNQVNKSINFYKWYINYYLPFINRILEKSSDNIANNKKCLNLGWDQKQLPHDYAVLARSPSIIWLLGFYILSLPICFINKQLPYIVIPKQ